MASQKSVDRQAIMEIYLRNSDALFRYAYRMLGDKDQAEDCVSETFERFLLVIRENHNPIQNVRAYLYRIAHNWILDHYHRQDDAHIALETERQADPSGSPAENYSDQQELERMRQAILRLPEDQRQVIVLRFLEGWSHAEVAESLGKSAEATRALQYRALGALRQQLGEQDHAIREDGP